SVSPYLPVVASAPETMVAQYQSQRGSRRAHQSAILSFIWVFLPWVAGRDWAPWSFEDAAPGGSVSASRRASTVDWPTPRRQRHCGTGLTIATGADRPSGCSTRSTRAP